MSVCLSVCLCQPLEEDLPRSNNDNSVSSLSWVNTVPGERLTGGQEGGGVAVKPEPRPGRSQQKLKAHFKPWCI